MPLTEKTVGAPRAATVEFLSSLSHLWLSKARKVAKPTSEKANISEVLGDDSKIQTRVTDYKANLADCKSADNKTKVVDSST
jgi:hypothetical protein